MKHFLNIFLFCILMSTGCRTMVITDEDFFKSRVMRDTLEAYLKNIDMSYSTADAPLITYVVVEDMGEEGSPIPTLFLSTARSSECAFPTASRDSIYSVYMGVHNGHPLLLSFPSRFKQYFKSRLKQSSRTKEEYLFQGKQLVGKPYDYQEYYVSFEILPDGSLTHEFHHMKSIYELR